MRGRTAGYYNTISASYGFQAGVQTFGYSLFLMSESAFTHLNSSDGWELGVGPSIVVLDAGRARALTTTTARARQVCRAARARPPVRRVRRSDLRNGPRRSRPTPVSREPPRDRVNGPKRGKQPPRIGPTPGPQARRRGPRDRASAKRARPTRRNLASRAIPSGPTYASRVTQNGKPIGKILRETIWTMIDWDNDWDDDDLGEALVAGAVVAGTAAVVGGAISSASTPVLCDL